MTAPAAPPSPLAPEAALWQDRQKIAQAQAATAQSFLPSATLAATKDAISTAAIQTGLGGVLTQYDTEYVAEDIATIVGNFLPAATTRIRIITDLSALADVATCDLLTAQIAHLAQQIDKFLDVGKTDDDSDDDSSDRDVIKTLGVGAGVFSALTSGAVTAANLATALVATSYQYSGASVAASTVAGLDLLIGHILQRDDCPVPIVIDRLQLSTDTTVQSTLAKLVNQADGLAPAVATARSDVAQATSLAKDAEAEVVRLDAEIAKGGDPTSDAGKALDSARKQAVTEAGNQQAAVAQAQARVDAGQALALTVATFAANVQSTPAAGVAPIVAAAHGEILRRQGTLLVYAKVVAAGVDIELKSNVLLGTKWYALSAVSAEYAIFDARGAQLTGGVRSVLQSSRATLRKGLADIKRERLLPPIVEAARSTKAAFTR